MKPILVLVLGLTGLSLAACNTIEGAGEDISYTGRVITGTADSVGDDMEEAME